MSKPLTIVASSPLVLAASLVLNLNEAVLDGPFGGPRLGLVVPNCLTVL